MPYWDKREEELFKKAWMSNKYEEEDLADLFGRTVESLRKKADRLKLPRKRYLEQKARLDAIEEALKKEHII